MCLLRHTAQMTQFRFQANKNTNTSVYLMYSAKMTHYDRENKPHRTSCLQPTPQHIGED